jgi:hypothetical protein
MLYGDHESVVIQQPVDDGEREPMNKCLAILTGNAGVGQGMMGNPVQRFLDTKEKIGAETGAVTAVPVGCTGQVGFGGFKKNASAVISVGGGS